MRTASPTCWTLPLSRWLTPSLLPMLRASSLLSRNWNDEVRPMTLKPENCDNVAIRFSDRPSEKNNWPGSPLAFTSGSTAMEFPRFANCIAALADATRVVSATSAASRRDDSTNLSNPK